MSMAKHKYSGNVEKIMPDYKRKESVRHAHKLFNILHDYRNLKTWKKVKNNV